MPEPTVNNPSITGLRQAVADQVAGHPDRRGILVCTSGIGVCIAGKQGPPGSARHGSHRGAGGSDTSAQQRQHRLPERSRNPLDTAKAIVETFLKTDFEGGRRGASRTTMEGKALAEVDPEILPRSARNAVARPKGSN